MRLVYHPDYSRAAPLRQHDAERPARILSFLDGEGLLRVRALRRPEPASLRTLRRVHTDEYLESLQRPEAWLPIFGFEVGAPQQAELLEAQQAMVGGTVLATRLALEQRGAAINLGGGLHHAAADRGQGFCVFNDVAVAIADAREQEFERTVLVVDLDLHDGEGTRRIFADDETVHTLSVHNRDLDSGPATASTSVALGDDVEDEVYLETLRSTLPTLFSELEPGLVLYVAGADPAADDTLGNWNIGDEAMLERDRLVWELTRECARPIPLVVMLGGGYGRNAWRYPARFLAWVLGGGRVVEPPATLELTVREFRHVARGLSPTDLTREPTDDWALTEEDLLGALRPDVVPSRFLGYYTRHGLELALERYGLMERLRARGFTRLRVDVELRESPQTLRVVSADLDEPLIELQARRDAATVPGMELLCVEWLLLQDPRLPFSPDRPALPNQRHPGLGLLREMVAMLLIACEQVGLDGIVFRPSQYHLAVSPRRFHRFLDPRHEARLQRLAAALRGVDLAKASHAVEEGRVVDVGTGRPFRWEPAPMVIPVSERLHRRVASAEYEREVERHRRGLAFGLVESGA